MYLTILAVAALLFILMYAQQSLAKQMKKAPIPIRSRKTRKR
jgi:hypothetical protein